MGRAYEVRKVAMAKTAAAKTKVYSKYGREIYVAAKAGVPDPELNSTLKRVCERAKKDQVPADIIKRAIDKAKGNSEESYSTVRYEGFGPGNSLFIVDCLTDNVNRTVAEVRNCFTKTGGKLGISGSVLHSFDNLSVFSFTGLTEDETLELLIMGDCEVTDIEVEDENITVYAAPTEYSKIRTSLLEAKPELEFELEEISWLPHSYVDIQGDDIDKFEKLQTMLDELDDVQNVYHNGSVKE